MSQPHVRKKYFPHSIILCLSLTYVWTTFCFLNWVVGLKFKITCNLAIPIIFNYFGKTPHNLIKYTQTVFTFICNKRTGSSKKNNTIIYLPKTKHFNTSFLNEILWEKSFWGYYLCFTEVFHKDFFRIF